MFYRLIVTANFPASPPPGWLESIKNHIEHNAITINPDLQNEELSHYEIHLCHHDEDPVKPCELIDEWTSQ